MASLTACIKKAGKAISAEDAAAIREIQQEHITAGMASDMAAQLAVNEYLDVLESNRNSILGDLITSGVNINSVARGTHLAGPLPARKEKKVVAPSAKKTRLAKKELHPDDALAADLVDAHPQHPVSQIFKLGHITSRINEKEASIPFLVRALNKTKDVLSVDQRQNLLATVHRRYLPDFLPGRVPSASEYIKVAQHMDGRRNELMRMTAEVVDKWFKFARAMPKRAALMGELMHAATKAGVTLGQPYKPLSALGNMSTKERKINAQREAAHIMLTKHYDKLGAEGQALYQEVRESYNDRRDLTIAALENRVKTSAATGKTKQSLLTLLHEKFESGRVQGDYFPLSRFGKFWSVAKDSAGNVVAFSKHESERQAEAWVEEFKAEGYENSQSGEVINDVNMMREVDPAFVASVTTRINELKEAGVDTAEVNQIMDEIWQLYLRSLPELSMRKQFIHRTGQLGFTADAMRSFGHHMFHGAHQLARIEHLPAMEAQLNVMEQEAKEVEQSGAKDSGWAIPLYNEMLKRHEWAMNPGGSKGAAMLTSLGFTMYLGLTPGAALVNLSQTALVAFPVMVSKFGASKSGAVLKELSRAAYQWAGSRKNMQDKLRGDERKAFLEAERTGLFEKTLAHDLAGISEDGMDYSQKQQRTMKIISWMFHTAEEFNRQVTFMASYRLARQETGNVADAHVKAMEKATGITWMSHFDYGNTNRPRILQNDTMKVAFLFKQFGFNTAYRLSRDFRDGVLRNPALSHESKKEALTRFLGIVGMSGLMSGISGMPGFWAITSIVEAMIGVFGDDDEFVNVENAVNVWLIEQGGGDTDLADYVMRGAWDKWTGMSLSTRVSLNDLFWRDIDESMEGKELSMHILGELTGPVVRLALDIPISLQNISEGHVQRGFERMMPKAVTDYSKAWRFLNEGALNYRDQPIVSAEEFTNWDIFVQSQGVTPSRLAIRYEENRAINERMDLIDNRKDLLTNRLFNAIRNDDRKEFADASTALFKFGKKHPSLRIDVGMLIRSAKQRNAHDRRTIDGLNLPKRHILLREQMRITPKK